MKLSYPLVLASSSKRRLHLLSTIGIVPDHVTSPDIDETAHKKELPKEYAFRMSYEKINKVLPLYPGKIIITADTVTACGRKIMPKALCEEDALFCINMLSGRRHRVYTSVCVSDPDRGILNRTALTIVKFKRMSDIEKKYYLQSKTWIGTAGGCNLQELCGAFVEYISGSFSNVVGLPVHETYKLLNPALY